MISISHPVDRTGLTLRGRHHAQEWRPASRSTRVDASRAFRRVAALALVIVTLGAPQLRAQDPTSPTPERELLLAVRRSNPQLLALRAALDAAEARARATGFVAPASLSAEIEEVPSGGNLVGAESMRLEVEREFFTGGRREARRTVAEQDVQRIRLELDLTERRVLARATQLLARVGGSAAIARRLAAEDSLLQTTEQALRPRFAVGDARYSDVLRLRTERLRARSDLAAALSAARVERQRLAGLLAGLDSATTAPPQHNLASDTLIVRLMALQQADVPDDPIPVPPDLDSLVHASAAVRRADAAVEQALALQRHVIAEQRPVVDVSLGAQRFVTEDGPTIGATLGASVSLPFTARRVNRLSREAADRAVRAARVSRHAAVAEVRAALGSALERYRTAREQLALYDAALLRGAREERESALASYRSGELSLLELLDFERALTRAEINRLRSRIAAVDALTDLVAGDGTSAADDSDLSGLLSEVQ